MRVVRCDLRPRFQEVWAELEERHGDRTWLVVADRHLLNRHPRALQGLGARRRRAVVDLPGGERVKRLSRLEDLAAAARANGLDRSGLVVALGGGTIGDLAGFFAGIWMRGVDWVPVATTTLAMADSAVGGKTAVDWGGLKNPLGVFHDPLAVYGVGEALESLGRRHFRAGLAEVVKSAVIADEALFARLEEEGPSLARGPSEGLLEVLAAAAAIKARVVARDPRERGIRAWLNYGHTVGHALESVHRPTLLHGEAVAAGMIAASLLSERLVGAPPGTTDRVEEALRRMGALRVLSPVDEPSLWGAMTSDKKSRRGALRVVVTPGIGSAEVVDLPSRQVLRQAIRGMFRRCAGRAKGNGR